MRSYSSSLSKSHRRMRARGSIFCAPPRVAGAPGGLMYCMWKPSSPGQRGKPDTFSKLRGPSRIFTGLHALAATHNHKNDAFLRRARRARCCEHQNRAQGLQCRRTQQCGDPRFCERWRFELHAVGATSPGDGATARRPAAAIQCNPVVRRGTTVGFPRRCSAPRAASASRSRSSSRRTRS